MPTHRETRILNHSSQKLFDLVAAVDCYPEFLPWCADARIRSRGESLIVADLVIGYRMFRERFTSTVKLTRPDRIDVKYSEGPFRYLDNYWVFTQIDKNSCTVDFFVDFEFKSAALQALIERIFNKAVKKMVLAFEYRADMLYGEMSTPLGDAD